MGHGPMNGKKKMLAKQRKGKTIDYKRRANNDLSEFQPNISEKHERIFVRIILFWMGAWMDGCPAAFHLLGKFSKKGKKKGLAANGQCLR